MMLHRYALALGSNRPHYRHGPPARVLGAALAALAARGVAVEAASPVLHSRAMGPAGRGFANGAAVVATPLDPPALLALLHAIEQAFGRRRGRRWGARVLDLDLILWSGGRWPRRLRAPRPGALAIPHGAFRERAFVLDPLAKIAGDWRDPVSGRSVRQLRARLRRR